MITLPSNMHRLHNIDLPDNMQIIIGTSDNKNKYFTALFDLDSESLVKRINCKSFGQACMKTCGLINLKQTGQYNDRY